MVVLDYFIIIKIVIIEVVVIIKVIIIIIIDVIIIIEVIVMMSLLSSHLRWTISPASHTRGGDTSVNGTIWMLLMHWGFKVRMIVVVVVVVETRTAIVIPIIDIVIDTVVPRGVGSRGQRDFQDSGLVCFQMGREIFKTCRKKRAATLHRGVLPPLRLMASASSEIDGVILSGTHRV